MVMYFGAYMYMLADLDNSVSQTFWLSQNYGVILVSQQQ